MGLKSNAIGGWHESRMTKLKLIRHVLEELERQKISYCVLRNYDFLLEEREPFSRAEKSIDLVISIEDQARFENLLYQLHFQKRKPQFSRCHHAYFRVESDQTTNNTAVISFDVQVGGAHWNDLRYLSAAQLMANRVKKSFFYVPAEEDTFVMLLVHSLLGKRYFKPEYAEKISALASPIDKDKVLACLTAIFNRRIAKELYRLAGAHDFQALLNKKYQYILYFILKSPRQAATFTALFVRWLHWKHFFRPSPLISFIGPDGAGKSTMAGLLATYLEQEGRKVSLVYTGRGRGQILPITALGRAYKRREKKRDAQMNNNLGMNETKAKANVAPLASSKGIRSLLYTVAAPFFTLDLLTRYALKIMPLRRSGKRRKPVVITDRYCSDILLMKHVPLPLKRMLLSFFPRPTLTFYLYHTPAQLQARRPRETTEELFRQLALFDQLKPSLKPVEIKTENRDKDFKTIVAAVQTLLYKEWY